MNSSPPNLAIRSVFLMHFKGSGITFAIGHSELNSSGAREVFGKGITHVTHLFNAMTGFHHREPGLAGAALDNEDVTVEIICDGIHINPSVVRIIMKCKPPEKVAIITDSTIAAGLEDGEYYLWDRPITVRNSEARLNNGVLSGSTLTMEDAVKNMVNRFGIPLEDTIIMASDTPARIVGVSSRKGGISPGRDADIVFLDDSLNVRLTMVKGRVVYSDL
jgi:N-acetylglucosamine-6-phosphate deacetylase